MWHWFNLLSLSLSGENSLPFTNRLLLDRLLVLIAGPNGSGKSTFKQRLKDDPDFPELDINADEIKKETGCTDLEAQAKAEQECEKA